MIGISCDPKESHVEWQKDICAYNGNTFLMLSLEFLKNIEFTIRFLCKQFEFPTKVSKGRPSIFRSSMMSPAPS